MNSYTRIHRHKHTLKCIDHVVPWSRMSTWQKRAFDSTGPANKQRKLVHTVARQSQLVL